MLPHDSTDLRAIDERRREMEREIRAIHYGSSVAAANRKLSRRDRISSGSGTPAETAAQPWWSGLCTGCGMRLEEMGKHLIALGKRLRNAAEAEKEKMVSPGY